MLKKLAILLCIFLLNACSSLPTPHRFQYDFHDNPNIELLEWEWAGHKRTYKPKLGNSITGASEYPDRLGNEIKIKWRNNQTNETKSETIPIKKGLPLSINNSEIRLIFNQLDKPEIYIFYNGPDPYTYFIFKNQSYIKKRARQIYPIIRELDSETLKDSRY